MQPRDGGKPERGGEAVHVTWGLSGVIFFCGLHFVFKHRQYKKEWLVDNTNVFRYHRIIKGSRTMHS